MLKQATVVARLTEESKARVQEEWSRVSAPTNKTYLVITVIALLVSGVALTKSYTNTGNISAQDSLITGLITDVDQLGVDVDNQLSELNDSIDDIIQTIDEAQQETDHIDAEVDQALESLNDYEAPISLIQEMALSGIEEAATIVAVQSSIDMIDSAGFHDMATNIAAGEISSRYLGTVQNVLTVVDAVEWPNSLLTEAASFRSALSDLVTDLTENDEEAAIESSEAAHHTQHDLSHGVYEWLSAQEKAGWIYNVGNLGEALANVRIQSAIDMINNVGFHDMATNIAAGEISSRYLGKVQNTIYVVRSLPWPADLTEKVKTFLTDLQGLEGALLTNDADLAVETSDVVHGSQHDLSHEVYNWLAHREGDSTVFTDGMVGEMIAMISVQSAADFVASIGTHGMAGSIADGEISSRYLGTVNNGIVVMASTTWPEELLSEAIELNEALGDLAEALEANNLEAATETSELAHEADDHFRGAAYDWLALNAESLETEEGDDHHGGGSAEQISIEASDWGFSMGHNAPVELTLEKGVAVELTVVNTGNMPHGIWSTDLNINEDVRAGQTVVISFTPEEIGEFTFYCNDSQCGTPDQHASMTGSITVTE
jgi:plastocyanin